MTNTFFLNKYFLFFYSLILIQPVLADDLYGIFMVVKGTVEVESVKTGKSVGKVGLKVYPGDKITTLKDSRAKISMSDRNVINVSPDSVLTIAKYENDPKSNVRNVELELAQGKVRNNVEQKYDGDKSKFIIKTPTAVAGVRGTQFLTSFDVKTRVTEVVTFKGVVQMAPVLANGQVSNSVVMIKKGEMSSVKQGQDNPEPPKVMPKEEMNKADKESQAKANQSSETKVADANEKPAEKPAEKQNEKKDKDKKVDADKSREPASDGNGKVVKERPAESMIDKKDMDFGAAKEIKPPLGTDVPVMQPQMPRLPPLVQPSQQNPVIDEIVRSKLNKTRVIVKPVLPN
ncbi:MAG: FecR domain-containing protein [Deltaproteobacteria bacterium]|nr:FecR domain-containing protein [Deltaproteobacteria bacterium]